MVLVRITFFPFAMYKMSFEHCYKLLWIYLQDFVWYFINPPVTLKSDNTFYPIDPSNLNLHNMIFFFFLLQKFV